MIYVKLFMFICLYELSTSAKEDQTKNVEPEEKYYDINKANELFEGFIKSYKKEYRHKKEHNYRFGVFVETLKKINELNKGSNGEVYGITEFADLTLDEFMHEHTGLKPDGTFNYTKQFRPGKRLSGQLKNVPENWDWRSKGIVSPAKNQFTCQSCWSFSAIACVESQYAKKHGVLLTLSEQQLVDCYKKSCQAGDYPHRALNYAARMGGLMSEQDYPYRGVVGRCQFQPAKVKVKVKGGSMVQARNEEELKGLVYTYGPVSIGMTIGHGFASYKSGIASAQKLGCRPHMPINHAVLIVGYGKENGVPYWIIKNSSGSRWGEQGFLRMVRGVDACNILQYVAVANVV